MLCRNTNEKISGKVLYFHRAAWNNVFSQSQQMFCLKNQVVSILDLGGGTKSLLQLFIFAIKLGKQLDNTQINEYGSVPIPLYL